MSAARHYVATPRGRLLTVDHHPEHQLPLHGAGRRLLANREVRALSRLAARADHAFGCPQDVEWAIDHDGTVLLLQSRPVTARGAMQATGPVLGPGPVGETFPDPLSPLETDLWVAPLRNGVCAALKETHAVPAHRLEGSPVVTTVQGRVAADLELFGYVPPRRTWARLDPRPPARRLRAAWRVGHVRAALPRRAAELVSEVDGFLAALRPADLGAEDSCGIEHGLLETS